MSVNYIINTPTYDNLPAYRLEYIALKIKMFIQLFGLQNCDWPLDCTKLLLIMKETQIIPFHYGFFRLPEKYEAITSFRSEHNVYLMQINMSKVRYPFDTSADRRLNFTIAHEIGHIMLDHLKVPRNLKTKADIIREEYEANEFAGKLLMPDTLLKSCNFFSFSAVAEFLNVSNSALLMRVNKIYRSDLLRHRNSSVCSNCGNTSMHHVAKYCCICGCALEGNTNGVLKIYYDNKIQLDNQREALSCPKCGCSELTFTGSCSNCNARYCEFCGSKTYFYTNGFLKPWEEERESYWASLVEGDF